MTIVCYECAADMIETDQDKYKCPRCGFGAEQLVIDGRQESMPDVRGWLTAAEAKATGKPVYVPDESGNSGTWNNGPMPTGGLLLGHTRCLQLLCPVKPGEQPAAYMYVARAAAPYRYAPFYFRTKDEIK